MIPRIGVHELLLFLGPSDEVRNALRYHRHGGFDVFRRPFDVNGVGIPVVPDEVHRGVFGDFDESASFATDQLLGNFWVARPVHHTQIIGLEDVVRFITVVHEFSLFRVRVDIDIRSRFRTVCALHMKLAGIEEVHSIGQKVTEVSLSVAVVRERIGVNESAGHCVRVSWKSMCRECLSVKDMVFYP